MDPAAQSVRNSVSAPVSTPCWLLRGFGGPPACSWIGLGRGGLGLQGGRNGIKQHLPPHEGPHLLGAHTHICVYSYVQLHMPNPLYTLQSIHTHRHTHHHPASLGSGGLLSSRQGISPPPAPPHQAELLGGSTFPAGPRASSPSPAGSRLGEESPSFPAEWQQPG